MNTQEYIALEKQYGATNYKPLDVVLDTRRGHLGLGRRRQPLPRLPVGLLGREPGALPPEDPRDDAGTSGEADPHLAGFPQRPIGPFLQRTLRADQVAPLRLPMNSGAEAVESASRRSASGATRSRACRKARPRSSSATTTSTAGPSPSSASAPSRSTATASRRSRPASRSSRTATRRRWKPPSPRTRSAFLVEPIQGEAGIIVPPAGYLQRCAAHLHRARHRADDRRDPDRPRPHRQAAGRGARRRRGGPDDDRQGALGRLLPGLGRALEQGRARRVPAGRSRQHVRRQSARLRGGADGAAGAGRRGHDRERGGDGRVPDGLSRSASKAHTSRKCAARA